MTIYLYIKQHAITGKKYFGRTTKRNPYKYKGSGSYWTNHIKKYGKEHVKTLDIFGFDDQELATEFALKFSADNDIVESNEWANLIVETGTHSFIEGQESFNKGKTYEEMYGIEKATELKRLRGETNTRAKTGIPLSDIAKANISKAVSGELNGFYDKNHTLKSKEQMKISAKNRPPASQETRDKLRKIHLGSKRTVETRKNQSISAIAGWEKRRLREKQERENER